MKECQFYITDTINNCKITPNTNCEDAININCPYRERLAWEAILQLVKHLSIDHQKKILQIAIDELNKIKYATATININ